MNKEIYGHLSAGQRATDGALRDAQADLLKLVMPVINIMEIINNSANLTSDSLCARTILKKLGDAITFAGNVNLALIKRGKEALRPCLPAEVTSYGFYFFSTHASLLTVFVCLIVCFHSCCSHKRLFGKTRE